MRRPTAFLLIAALSGGLCIAVSAGINYLVDPYAIFGTNRIGLYAFDSYDERRYKLQILNRPEFNAIIFGSSKAARIDPSRLTTHRFLNAAFHAVRPEEIRDLIDVYVDKQKAAVLMMDLYMFSDGFMPYIGLNTDPDVAPDLKQRLSKLFTLQATWASVSALGKWALGVKPVVLSNGQFNTAERDHADAVMTEYVDAEWLGVLRENHFHNFKYSERRVQDIRTAMSMLEEKGVRSYLILNPLSPPVLALIDKLGLEGDLQRLRHDLKELSPRFLDLSDGPVSVRSNFYKADPYHYKLGVVEPILNEMLSVEY